MIEGLDRALEDCPQADMTVVRKLIEELLDGLFQVRLEGHRALQSGPLGRVDRRGRIRRWRRIDDD